MIAPPKIQYCTRCVYPSTAATPLTFDSDGVCSGCLTHAEQKKIDWKERAEWFLELCNEYRGKGYYDCLIPVSGGKDSFYQIHVLKSFSMNPLLVTYNENNETDLGKRNIQRMKETFGCDYINFTPSIHVLKRMNRVGFLKMGDPDMHAHIGINSVPIQMAVKYSIPLIIWGEHGFMNLGGMHSYRDMVEYTARFRKEHLNHGYDWQDFVGVEGLTERDLGCFKYPSDAYIDRVGIRGIFISNYFGWNQNRHSEEMRRRYGFEYASHPFDRTYKLDSNLNNFHDNGLHDYMKYIKFGYGRATDHASRDIRNGDMTRKEGVQLVRRFDGVFPSDVPRWLNYVGMDYQEFSATVDGFRSPKVWIKNEYGQWIKDELH